MSKLEIKNQKEFKKRFKGEYIKLNELVHKNIEEQSQSDLKYWSNFDKQMGYNIKFANENGIDLNYSESGWYYKD